MRSLFSIFHRRNPSTPRVYLHIGPHKTGTTTIQHILLNSVDSVRYCNPGKTGPGHSEIAKELMSPEGIRPGRNAILERIGSERWNGPDNAPIVFSSEDFSLAALKPESSVKFAELADSFQTELILTHRPIAHRVYSFIQEHVKHGNLDNAFDGTEISWEHLLKMKFFRHDYFARMVGMGKWMKCHVVVVDKTRAYFLREAFSSILGVPLDGTGDPGMLNQSMPYMQMRILYGLHREGYAGGIEERLEKSTEMFERLRDTDPEKAATPYPPIPRHVLRRMEEMDAELELSLSELERCGRLIVHRPDGA